MDCQQVQHDLLSAESLGLLGPELAAHLAECPECKALLEQLRRLEMETRQLPVPAGHEQPSPEFLRQIAAVRPKHAAHRLVRRLIAAIVVLAFTLAAISLILFNGSSVQADVLINQLVDWNLNIAHTHSATERARIYQQQLTQMRQQVAHTDLAPADRALADSLLNNAQWLTTENNASDEAQHFQSIANQLLARRQALNDGSAQKFETIYQKLIDQVRQGQTAPTQPNSTSPSGDARPVGPGAALTPNSISPRSIETPSQSSTAMTQSEFVLPPSVRFESGGRTISGGYANALSLSNRTPGASVPGYVERFDSRHHLTPHLTGVALPTDPSGPERTSVTPGPSNQPGPQGGTAHGNN
ncbi:MAG TPA: hypothetical protein VG722_13520, partial [Tepidisphaeraceae bacterium]|nr:hypothetical protein [Tepidisphaeraceae bacterium]